MNLKEIKEIIALMNDNNLNEIEIEREGQKLKLKKAADGVMMSGGGHYALESIPAPKMQASASVVAAAPVASKPSGGIKSPMVGTFYRSPSPEAASFVEVGQIVEIGQVVCIVEAMKLMNEIKSEIRGKVIAVEVQNAEPVEFGQILFAVEPA